MDRRRLLGVALAAASACGYGSGALFAKSVYGAGIDWLALLYLAIPDRRERSSGRGRSS